ncbi:MAG: hypothetical protein ACC647_01165, partial [Anaerolineales bacterium]
GGRISPTMDSVAQTGDPAPEFELMGLDGQMHSLRDWLGSVVRGLSPEPSETLPFGCAIIRHTP